MVDYKLDTVFPQHSIDKSPSYLLFSEVFRAYLEHGSAFLSATMIFSYLNSIDMAARLVPLA